MLKQTRSIKPIIARYFRSTNPIRYTSSASNSSDPKQINVSYTQEELKQRKSKLESYESKTKLTDEEIKQHVNDAKEGFESLQDKGEKVATEQERADDFM